MSFRHILGLFLLSIFSASTLFAHQYVNCRNLDNNSCWHALNQTNERVTVQCSNFQTGQLLPGQMYSFQFCSGLADGLGYSVDQVKCQIHFQQPPSLPIEFGSVGYGDRVQIKVEPEKVTVTLRNSWGSHRDVVREFLRPHSEM